MKEKRLQEEKEEKERREAEEKELADDPYNENVSICTLLIDYCKKLQPKQAKQEIKENKPQVDVEQLITTNKEWKKDNVQYVAAKKNLDEQSTRCARSW